MTCALAKNGFEQLFPIPRALIEAFMARHTAMNAIKRNATDLQDSTSALPLEIQDGCTRIAKEHGSLKRAERTRLYPCSVTSSYLSFLGNIVTFSESSL